MPEEKLVIQPHRYGGKSTVVSVRLPEEMLSVIDGVAADTGRTRNEIIVLSMEFALEHIQIEKR